MIDFLIDSDIERSVDKIKNIARKVIPSGIIRLKISEWAETKRVLSEGFHPGPFSFEVTPYLKEIADCLSPDSPIREVALMKGSRMGATVGVGENFIGFHIEHGSGNFGYATSDAETAGAQMETRIDELINTAGIGHLIGAKDSDKRKNQKKTGDRALRKRIPSGYLLAGGPNASYFKRSFGYSAFYGDEIDADAWELAMKDGDKIYLIRRRLAEYEDTYKALWTSSPKKEHNSNIFKLYKEGDQRKYFVPCKKCGHMQFLKWKQLKFEHDENDILIAEYNGDGEIVKSSVHYECEKCGAKWSNSDKNYFLPLGEWIPTAQPRRPGMRSYHLPALLAPVGSISWEKGVIDYLQIKHELFNPLKFQVWVNTYLGEPFEDRGERPKIEVLLTRDRTYHVGNLPVDAKPVFITIGADVQKNRIECEIVAWGVDKESWSVDYIVLPGDTEDLDDACWTTFREIIGKKYFGMQPLLTGIDSGYRTEQVYSFCDTFESGVHPVMGSDEVVKARKYINLFSVEGHNSPRIDINTDLMKQEIYQYLQKGIHEGGNVPKGYCHFPIEYSREHFNRLTAENRIMVTNSKGGKRYKWDAGERRNEQLDCRVYNLAMVYGYRLYIETALRESGDIEETYTLTWDDFWNYIQS